MAALLGLIAAVHAAEPTPIGDFAPRPLWHAGDVPSERGYRRVVEVDGAVSGRSSAKRRPRYVLWALRDGVVVRLEEREGSRVVLTRRFDPMGQPLTSVHEPRDGSSWVTVHLVPEREIGLSGWEDREIPGGHVRLPTALVDDGAWVLGGRLEVWHDPRVVDVTGDDFWQGLLAGCGCDLVDRVTAWVDGRPGVRIRLARGADIQELWAVPIGERGTWFASFRAPDVAAEVTSLRLAPGRALVALVRLDRLAKLEGPP